MEKVELSAEYLLAFIQSAEGQAYIRDQVQTDKVDGYETFYNIIWNRSLPKHSKDWAQEIYQCPRGGNLGLEAFRGSFKTTGVTNTFLAYQVGCHPERRNLILRASDDMAFESSAWIAQTIEFNPAWKICFPHVVPDKKAGWSTNGYEVMRTDMDYGEFRRSIGQNPCFVGYGYTSKSYHGYHPDGLLILDDIDTELNTRSDRERDEVRSIITGTVMPMRNPGETKFIVIGTPWRKNDTLGYFRNMSTFKWCYLPVEKDGEPTYPERFSKERIAIIRSETPAMEFARQYLLDVNAAEGQKLKREWLHTYDADKISPNWPCYFGVDYASASDRLRRGKEGDYFAIAIGRLIPGGGLVIVDVVRDQVSQGEAELKLANLNEILHPAYIGVEDLGTGKEFYQLLVRSTKLPVISSKVSNKSKGQRFEKELGPAFQFGRAFLSSVATDGLRAFEDEWVGYDHADHDDTLDAVWHCMKTAMGELTNVSDAAIADRPRKKRDWAGMGLRQ